MENLKYAYDYDEYDEVENFDEDMEVECGMLRQKIIGAIGLVLSLATIPILMDATAGITFGAFSLYVMFTKQYILS